MTRPVFVLIARGSIAALALVLSVFGTALAQVNTSIGSVAPAEAIAESPVTLRAELLSGENISHVVLVYRPYGESEYRKADMDIAGNTASFTIPAKAIIPPALEYYIVLTRRDGKLETYPVSETPDPFSTPPAQTLRLPVRSALAQDEQIVFLSPEAESQIAPEDVLVSLSLLRVDSLVITSATQIFLDGANITNDCVFSDDIVVYSPENFNVRLSPGSHRVGVRLFSRDGELYRTATLNFVVRGDLLLGAAEATPPGIRYAVGAQAESRREEVQGTSTWFNRAGYQFTGRTGILKVTSNAFVTSDEQSDRQAQNRFFIGAEIPWLMAGYGDSYPSFPDLILSGKRVRGLVSSLHLGFLNLDVTMGQTLRSVEGTLLKSFSADSFSLETARDPSAAYGRINPTTWGKYSYGTYARDMLAVRPSFGSGETYQWGITWLKAKDDVGSIKYGVRPQENAVIGSDFVLRIDHRHIELSAQAAFSAYNTDISSGQFNDAYIDSVYKSDASTIKNVRDILGRLITVNDNLRPLSLKKLSTLAYETALAINYFDNVLKLSYVYRGSDYNSFGQSYLRKDIQGYNLQDRIRLVGNQVFLSAGYESLTDNTSGSKSSTTTYNTINTAVSFYPREHAPNVTIGYSRFDNSNGLRVDGPDSLVAVSDVTDRVFVQSSYEIDYLARHTLSLNVSTSDRVDQTIRSYGVQSTSVGLGIATRFGFPLQTSLDCTLNFTKLPDGIIPRASRRLNYTTLGMQGRYGIIPEVVLVNASFNPSFGDFSRSVLDAGVDWYIVPTLCFSTQFSFLTYDGATSDNFLSMRLRYDL